jgi:hypothetical protein
MSMHPSIEAGRRRFEKVNTCGNSSKSSRLTKQLNGILRHLETNPRDSLSQQRVSTIKSLLTA